MDRQATATTDMMVATDRVTAEQAILRSDLTFVPNKQLVVALS